MTVVSHVRPARCSDCKFCDPIMVGKLKRNRCDNPKSPRHNEDKQKPTIRLRDLVCDEWKLF